MMSPNRKLLCHVLAFCLLAGIAGFREAAHADNGSPATPGQPPVVSPQPQSPAAQPTTEAAPESAGAASQVVAPTDQPPPEVPAPTPLVFGKRTIIGGALDLRYRLSDTGPTHTSWLQNAEMDVTYPIITKGVANGNVVIEAMGENPPDVPRGFDVEFGQAYAIYKLPINTEGDSTAYVKAGQFQIPFALLAVYDPHETISQPLYAQSLGLRNDWGVDISGRFYTVLNYDFAMTRGVGPNVIGQVDPTEVVTFRLGRTFYTRNGTVNVGGSLLQGRLPVTDIDAQYPYAVELPPSGRVTADEGYTNKSRVAGDGTLLYKNITARGEAVVGADNDNKVYGLYVEGEYRVGGHLDGVLARSSWRYPVGDSFSTDDQIGFTYATSPNLTWRCLEESMLDRPRYLGTNAHKRFTVQVLFRF